MHVLGGTAEGHGDEIDGKLSGDLDVLAVLRRQRAERQAAAEPVQSLAVGQHAVGEHFRVDGVVDDTQHFQGDQAIVEQQGVARVHVVHQAEIADADAVRVAWRGIGAADQVEAGASLERHLAGGETLDADLRPLQVGEDADFAALLRRCRTHRRHACRLLLGRAMGKIQAHDVDAGADEIIEHTGDIGGRAEGGQDLGATQVFGHGNALVCANASTGALRPGNTC